jgi:hypothetical protein
MANPADERNEQREREYEELRAKDRARRSAGDRNRFRQSRRADAPARSNVATVARDVDRLAYSVSRAGVRAYFGTVNALGDLLLNLTDTYYAYPYDQHDRNRNDDERGRDRNDDERGRARSHDRDSRRERSVPSERSRSYYNDLYGDLSQAVRDTADVIADSANEFSRVYDEEKERDDDFEERDAREREDEERVKPERPRRHTPPVADRPKDPTV